jgi:hypothetical protein
MRQLLPLFSVRTCYQLEHAPDITNVTILESRKKAHGAVVPAPDRAGVKDSAPSSRV